MSNIFFCSDHHLGHNNILTFKRNDETPLRSFSSIIEHDEYLIYKHNCVVKSTDKVYFLGDVCNKGTLHKLGRMNGEKILIKGNHDTLKISEYTTYFKDIRGCHQFEGMLLTHIPVHTNSLGRWPVNVHGHLHHNIVTRTIQGIGEVPDPRYFNVSMECLEDYTPISLEDLKKEHKFRLDHDF